MSAPARPLETLAEARALDLALIGNCRIAALVNGVGRIVWWCFPGFDSNPVFCRLLAGDEEKGFCDVVVADLVDTKSGYARNTAILETELEDRHGGRVRITDFAPRFPRYERIFRPPQLIRRITPLAGLPRITIRVRPCHSYGRPVIDLSMGSNHIRYQGADPVLRLTTDAPLSYIVQETAFPLTRPLTLILGPDEPFQSAVDSTGREFEEHTRDYWYGWVRSLAVPFEWQSAVTRAAMTLLLCSLRRPGASSPRIRPRSPRLPAAAGTGTTAIAGCAMPISSSRR